MYQTLYLDTQKETLMTTLSTDWLSINNIFTSQFDRIVPMVYCLTVRKDARTYRRILQKLIQLNVSSYSSPKSPQIIKQSSNANEYCFFFLAFCNMIDEPLFRFLTVRVLNRSNT